MERQLAYVTNGVRRPSLQRKEAAANAQLAGALLVQSEGGGRAASWAEAKVVSSEAEMRAQLVQCKRDTLAHDKVGINMCESGACGGR